LHLTPLVGDAAPPAEDRGAASVRSPLAARVVAGTASARYLSCPRRYFTERLRYVRILSLPGGTASCVRWQTNCGRARARPLAGAAVAVLIPCCFTGRAGESSTSWLRCQLNWRGKWKPDIACSSS
uniref:Uncharacterized protein n=2 Tax=Triticum urartu TaxID=4572 RepID=A0A8R7K4J0_TRIUA